MDEGACAAGGPGGNQNSDLGQCFDGWFRLSCEQLLIPKASEPMQLEAFFEKVPIDRLGSLGAFPCGDDHLTIGGSDAAGCIQSFDARAQARVNADLAFLIQLCPEAF